MGSIIDSTSSMNFEDTCSFSYMQKVEDPRVCSRYVVLRSTVNRVKYRYQMWEMEDETCQNGY